MPLVRNIKLKNFRNFREEASIELSQSSFLVGINNTGKTNILQAVRAFFDDSYFFDESFLNKTEFLGKGGRYNQSEIVLSFDLRELTTKKRKIALVKEYGNILNIKKIVTFLPKSRSVYIKYNIDGNDYDRDELPENVRWLLSKIKVTYIHPQEGQNLFDNVQKRLRQRLLQNWGRGAALTHNMGELQEKWIEMRVAANRYLSKSLSDSLQSFWPGCRVIIDLPKNIADVINVSDINFRGHDALPEIELTSQGTGAQSTVLYLAQYLLDSDRSLNKGEYHPLWLMEEPESFLHADLLIKISNQINSDSWLDNIQMIVSTHSPILLASSRVVGGRVIWNVLRGADGIESVNPIDATDKNITEIGSLMGDSNFFAYFASAQKDKLIFIEDSRDITRDIFRKSGIPITKNQGGVSDLARYIDVFLSTPDVLKTPAYFIIDSDEGGKKDKNMKRYIENSDEIERSDNIKKLKVRGSCNIFIIALGDGEAVEDLFSEYEKHVLNCIYEIWNKDFSLKSSVPPELSGVVSKAKKFKESVKNEKEAFNLIKNEQEIKDIFWLKVKKFNYEIAKVNVDCLKKLIY